VRTHFGDPECSNFAWRAVPLPVGRGVLMPAWWRRTPKPPRSVPPSRSSPRMIPGRPGDVGHPMRYPSCSRRPRLQA
jgi:hypothetical protein